ncbi:helix-turn-helix domain-containing protein [Fulvivirga sedimenti]|uniref:Helix-turn-helix domain-containing protein n=1 Tax=Fulvivirga sedimenti TaxID=2879465 RepID=A0A9X1HYD4_9BACT|nr:helix-turn-helix domain-containing protein [Fulvivirga sedimenti]
METKSILSQQELAEYLTCSRQHIINLQKQGVLKPKKLGKRTYYLLEDIIEYLK